MPKLFGTLFKRTSGVLPTFSRMVDMIFLRASLEWHQKELISHFPRLIQIWRQWIRLIECLRLSLGVGRGAFISLDVPCAATGQIRADEIGGYFSSHRDLVTWFYSHIKLISVNYNSGATIISNDIKIHQFQSIVFPSQSSRLLIIQNWNQFIQLILLFLLRSLTPTWLCS